MYYDHEYYYFDVNFIQNVFSSCGVYDIIDPRCVTFGTDMTMPYPKCCQPYCVEFEEGVDAATRLRLGRASVK